MNSVFSKLAAGTVVAPFPCKWVALVEGNWDHPLNAADLGVAAWALVAEGLEILVVWLGVALREGGGTATLGFGIGLAVVVGFILGGTGVFRKVPPYVLDGVDAVIVLGYGAYFLSLAIAAA